MRAIIFIFCFCFMPAPASAENPGMNIESLVSKVLANNPEIAFYEAEVSAAQAGRSVAGKPRNPELSFGIGSMHVRGGNTIAGEGVAYSASLAQPIEWRGRLSLRKAIANRNIELSELGLTRFRIFLSARVRMLAYVLATQQDVANTAKEVAERYRAMKHVLLQRDPQGVTSLLESKTIEAATLVAQAKAGEAAIAVQKVLLELNQLMGEKADGSLNVSRPDFSFTPMPELSELLAKAFEENYDLRVRRSELEQQGLKVDLAKNERYPTVTVGPFLSQERIISGDETVVGLGFSVPLPLWDPGTAKVSTEEARHIQAQATLSTAQQEVERQVTEAALLYKAMRSRLDLWKDTTITKFSEAATIADKHYRLGAVPIGTYVALQDKYLEAVEAICSSQAQALEAAILLEQLIGTPETLIKLKSK